MVFLASGREDVRREELETLANQQAPEMEDGWTHVPQEIYILLGLPSEAHPDQFFPPEDSISDQSLAINPAQRAERPAGQPTNRAQQRGAVGFNTGVENAQGESVRTMEDMMKLACEGLVSSTAALRERGGDGSTDRFNKLQDLAHLETRPMKKEKLCDLMWKELGIDNVEE